MIFLTKETQKDVISLMLMQMIFMTKEKLMRIGGKM